MPTSQIDGYKFRFYSSAVDEPPHSHILDGNKVATIWLPPLAAEYNRGYNATELNYVLKLTRRNRTTLLEA